MFRKLPVFLGFVAFWLISACGDNQSDPSTIADYVRQDSRFSSLEKTLRDADSLKVLDGPGPFTLFAIRDENFPEQLLTPEKLAEFADYHIHQGELSVEGMKRLTAISTLAGSEIHVRYGHGGVLLNDGVLVGGETIDADNGVIHVLDAALLRPLITTTTKYQRVPGALIDGSLSDFVNIEDTGFIHSLRVEVEIEQESINGMGIYLRHIQSEKTVQLMANPRSSLSDVNLTFADSASLDVMDNVKRGNQGQAFPNTSYRPYTPLENMVGEALEGQWQLIIINFLNGDETSKLVRWSLITTAGAALPEEAIVFNPRSIKAGVMGRRFTEESHIRLQRVGGLVGMVTLDGKAGEIAATTRILDLEENQGTLLFDVPADAQLGPVTIELSARSADVSRILMLDSAIAQPDADGIELLAHIPVTLLGAEGHEGNDIWGWTDPQTGAEIALVGTSIGTSFVDVSIPESPVVLGSLPTHTGASLWHDVKVHGDYAYIVSEAEEHGMQIFDLTQLRGITAPQTFAETAHISLFGSAHNIAITEETETAYVVGADIESCFGGLLIFDLSTPMSPSYTGCFSGGIAAGQAAGPLYPSDVYTHDLQCVIYSGPDLDYQGRELCFTSDEQTVGIVDMQDKSNPTQIVRIYYEGAGYTHQGWLTEDHRFFIMNDEFDELNQPLISTRSYVWDLQDLDNPVYLGTLDNPRDAIGHNAYIVDKVIYQANYTSGLRLIGLDGLPTLPENVSPELAYYDTYPEDDARCNSGEGCGTASYDGAWSNYPFFASGTILVSDIKRGLFVLRRTN
ncbi:MAG: choice-of-anchor B family protein [Kofleriaceae bacterium]|nr:choice-of-anchor B family protein [Kofleriaceae bacterium]